MSASPFREVRGDAGRGEDAYSRIMKRMFAAALAACLVTAPAAADRLSLKEVSTYLNTLTNARADFVQVNGDGSRSSGTLTLKRPGRARFEYDPPNEAALVLASGGQVAVFDDRASGRPEQYALRQTPLNILLARNVDLTRTRMVTGHGEQGDRTIVQAQDPDHPEYGTIWMYFNQNPVRLSEWLITSDTGEKTRIILEPFTNPGNLPPSLFDVSREIGRR